MITRIRVPAPVPDAVADLVEAHLPKSVRDADAVARGALYAFRVSRTPLTREARERAAADAARANKVLAAFNPGLVVTLGGAR